jgi:hypothetical protein
MNKRLKLGLIVIILVVAAVLASVWAFVYFQNHSLFLQRHVQPPGAIPGDIEFFYVANAIVSTINIALLLILVFIYIDLYSKTRSPFTVGLLIFSLVFLVKDLTSNPLVASIYGFRAYGLGPFVFLPGLFELVALSILLYLSVRY